MVGLENCSASGTLDHELHHIQEMLTARPGGFSSSESLCGFVLTAPLHQYAAIGMRGGSHAGGSQPAILVQKHHDGHLSDVLI